MYKIVGCTACRQLQVTAANKTFQCKYCGRLCELAKAVIHYRSTDPDEVFYKRLKMEAGENAQK